MRSVLLVILLILLFACLVAGWAHRFAPVDGVTRVGVNSLVLLSDAPPQFERGEAGWAMRHAGAGRPAIALFGIPGSEGARHLHIRFDARAVDLAPGVELWSDGRLFIVWLDREDGDVVGISPIHSARGDGGGGIRTLVAHSPRPGAVPRVRYEHLGISGRFEVGLLDITPARERAVWRIGSWAILVGTIAVLAVWVRSRKKPARWRGWLAAGVWGWVAVSYAVPGPWDSARPFGVPFEFPEVGEIQDGGEVGMDVIPVVFSAAEELPAPEALGLRIKLGLPWLRPLLHIALLFAPVLFWAWFVGPRGALILGALLSLLIELAQVMFGFGFGWDDVGDLFFNSLGIVGALWLHRKFARWLHAWLPRPFPGPA